MSAKFTQGRFNFPGSSRNMTLKTSASKLLKTGSTEKLSSVVPVAGRERSARVLDTISLARKRVSSRFSSSPQQTPDQKISAGSPPANVKDGPGEDDMPTYDELKKIFKR